MAASRVYLYKKFTEYLARGVFDFNGTVPINAIALTDGYSPSTVSHSVVAQVTNFQASASTTLVAVIALANVSASTSGLNTTKIKADNISGFSGFGDTIASLKYVALFQSSSGTVNNPLIGFFDVDNATGDASAGQSTQVNINWNAKISKLIEIGL